MTRADVIVVLLALALLPVLYARYWQGGAPGESVIVRVDGAPALELPLTHDRTLAVTGVLGESTLEIRDGAIRFVDSPCNGKQCVYSGWSSDGGSFGACLPNRVSIEIVGAASRYDSINF